MIRLKITVFLRVYYFYFINVPHFADENNSYSKKKKKKWKKLVSRHITEVRPDWRHFSRYTITCYGVLKKSRKPQTIFFNPPWLLFVHVPVILSVCAHFSVSICTTFYPSSPSVALPLRLLQDTVEVVAICSRKRFCIRKENVDTSYDHKF